MQLALAGAILRDRGSFIDRVREGDELRTLCLQLSGISAVSFAGYGVIIGLGHGFAQALSVAVKLPLLFLLTMVICFPTLHVFTLLLGGKRTAMQHLALLLTATTMTAMLMLAFAPVSLFFLITTDSGDFFKLLNIVVIAISGVVGIRLFHEGTQVLNFGDTDKPTRARLRQLTSAWIVMYGLVGLQMAWALRPFFGDPGEPFALFRQFGGNVFRDLLHTGSRIMGM